MHYVYYPKMVCSSKVEFDIEGDKVTNVVFTGGCNGNLKAIAKLVDGMDYHDVVSKLQGNTCGYRNTSCADQFTKAIIEAVEKSK